MPRECSVCGESEGNIANLTLYPEVMLCDEGSCLEAAIVVYPDITGC